MDVSIIIVNYNTFQISSDCINSIFSFTRDIDFEVIVVDNNSTDTSQEKFPLDKRIKFIEAGENLGFGKANNLGVKYACGKYLFFLNSDTLLLNNAIKLLFDFYEENEVNFSLGALGCHLLTKDYQPAHSYGPFPTMKRELMAEWGDHVLRRIGKHMKRFDEFYLEHKQKDYFPVDYVTGADLFVSRKVFEKYGGFDPDFFMYYEETEMQFRWSRFDIHSYVIKGPQIIHLEGASQRKKSARKLFSGVNSQFIYCKKTYSKTEYIVFRILFFISRMITMPWQNLTTKEKREYMALLTKNIKRFSK